jgi:hypothetical protein
MCANKIATGQMAVQHSMGWGWGCQTGFYENMTGVPKCASFDGWWGTRTNGQQCYYNELGPKISSELCVDGYYCAMENSTCSMDKPDTANCTVNGYDCYDKERNSNAGSCHCTTTGQNPMCVHSSCGQAGPRMASMWAAEAKCGQMTSPMSGKCPSTGTYDDKWDGSCLLRVSACYPSKSWYACTGKFEIDQWKKVLLPSGSVCGMSLSPSIMQWPSYCSSASLTQPLLVVVAGLMALLRL